MYRNHFGLRGHPFAPTPDTERFFAGGERKKILEQLIEAIQGGEWMIQVIGTPGSGKTMLCRMLCQSLPSSTQLALLLNPNLSSRELIPSILNEFRVSTPDQKDRVAIRHALLDHLLTLHRRGDRALLVIDDAHCMPPATLEELRLLGNMETRQAKLLQVVLFAHPALESLLHHETVSHLGERISTRLTLRPLTVPETEAYLLTRLQAVGAVGSSLFSPRALRCLQRASKGGLQQINHLAHRALQHAQTESAAQVTARHVNRAIQGDSCSGFRFPGSRPMVATVGTALLLAGGIVLHSWAIGPMLTAAHDNPVLRVEPAIPSDQTAAGTAPPAPLPLPAAVQQVTPAASAVLSALPADPASSVTPDQASMALTMAQALTPPAQTEHRPVQTVQAAPPVSPVKLPTGPQPCLKPEDPLKEAILASHHWLEQGDEAHYTIQLSLLNHDTGLKNVMEQLTTVPSPPDGFVLKIFRTYDDKLLVYLNECPSSQACEALLERLPSGMKAKQPRVRSLARLKTTVQKLALTVPRLAG
ncbi:MAG: AAA family ATPase [Magnetococcales bacterium]|nr:AAA family ATPase [Magnetococcales bacterium]